MQKLLLIMCFLGISSILVAQTTVYVDGKESLQLPPSNQSPVQLAKRKVNELVIKGYLFAGMDSITRKETTTNIYLYKGEKKVIFIDSIEILGNDQLQLAFKRGKFSSQVLKDFITNGYPFAQLYWENLRQDGKENIHGTLSIDPGPFIVNDTLFLLAPVKTKKEFIQQTINLEPGKPYNENAYQKVTDRLQQLDFLELSSAPDIAFSGGRATTYLNLKENKASSFEGIIGLLPNQTSEGGMLVTGYLNLNLGNLFYAGKQLLLNWQQFAPSSQQLSIAYSHPYLLGSDVLVGGSFDLVKQDTTFITRNMQLEIGTFLFGNNIRFDGVYARNTGNLISPGVDYVTTQNLADYSTDFYSIHLSRQIRYNTFRNYWSFEVEATLGRKEIERNAALPSEYYDTLVQNSTVYKLQTHIQWQQVLFGRTAFFIDYDMGLLENAQILRNELYRVGGLKSLRGFNENFFFAQSYFLPRMELRQYFEQNSYLFVFYDQLFYHTFSQWDQPFGLGTGLSLDTSNGLFSFAFALGSSSDIPFDINNTKIHLGYISRF